MKITIKSVFGKVIFEWDEADNTIKKTLLKAIKNKANLRGADLSGADLRDAYLRGADLRGAYLSGADLSYADLRDAYLRDAYLRGAYLNGANLRGAYLSYADLRDADLRDAYLSGADLRDADLRDAYLSGAKNAELAIAMTRILPEGDLIGYKKAFLEGHKKTIVKILIPKEAKRSSAFGRKCRAEYAECLDIDGGMKAYSDNDHDFWYEVGKRAVPTKPFDENFTQECSTGIHFFITRLEAENY